jgi:hypothetical protein
VERSGDPAADWSCRIEDLGIGEGGDRSREAVVVVAAAGGEGQRREEVVGEGVGEVGELQRLVPRARV